MLALHSSHQHVVPTLELQPEDAPASRLSEATLLSMRQNVSRRFQETLSALRAYVDKSEVPSGKNDSRPAATLVHSGDLDLPMVEQDGLAPATDLQDYARLRTEALAREAGLWVECLEGRVARGEFTGDHPAWALQAAKAASADVSELEKRQEALEPLRVAVDLRWIVESMLESYARTGQNRHTADAIRVQLAAAKVRHVDLRDLEARFEALHGFNT